jgi:hypothetical protein
MDSRLGWELDPAVAERAVRGLDEVELLLERR